MSTAMSQKRKKQPEAKPLSDWLDSVLYYVWHSFEFTFSEQCDLFAPEFFHEDKLNEM